MQLANNMPEQQQQKQQAKSPAAESPAVQLANSMAGQQQKQQQGQSPAVQMANNMYEKQKQQRPQDSSSQKGSTGAAADDAVRTPADMLNEGIRAAAETAEDAISRTAAAAQQGIEGATNLTTQGISAAEAAAEAAVTNLTAAAESTVQAAATAVGAAAGTAAGTAEAAVKGAATAAGAAAGAADGIASAATSGSSRQRVSSSSSGGSASATGSFDTVNVRVPGNMAWANATPARGPIRDMTLTQDFDEEEVEGLKVKILAAVASLDRGLAANMREASEVDKLCKRLEEAAGPITLRWSTSRSSPDASTMDKLAGTWRLVYSSGFNGGSLGGSRPGPPAALVPTVLGQVYQVIDADKVLLDNVVELLLAYGVPQLPFLPRPDPQPTPGVRLTLRHTYEVAQPNTVTIVFESTSARTVGPDVLQGLPQFDVPQLPDFLKPPKNFRSASFDVSYLDASMRITRGDRGELRIYLRDRPLEAQAPADYVD